MKEDFGPYLPSILPGVFSMATLNPEMGVAGTEAVANLTDVLREIKSDPSGEKGVNIVTDEIEEKDVAIQMLAVFIESLSALMKFWGDSCLCLLSLDEAWKGRCT